MAVAQSTKQAKRIETVGLKGGKTHLHERYHRVRCSWPVPPFNDGHDRRSNLALVDQPKAHHAAIGAGPQKANLKMHPGGCMRTL